MTIINIQERYAREYADIPVTAGVYGNNRKRRASCHKRFFLELERHFPWMSHLEQSIAWGDVIDMAILYRYED